MRTRPKPDHHRGIALTLAALGCAAAIVACGSSSKPSSAGNRPSSGGVAGIAFSDCMRSHGVSDFPDPLPGGGFNIPSDINTSAPAFQAANKACGNQAPGAITPPKLSEQQKALAVKQSTCIRANRVPQFPDPTVNVPDQGTLPSGMDAILRNGMLWVFPASEIGSPAFDSAAQQCGLFPRGLLRRLPPGFHGLLPAPGTLARMSSP